MFQVKAIERGLNDEYHIHAVMLFPNNLTYKQIIQLIQNQNEFNLDIQAKELSSKLSVIKSMEYIFKNFEHNVSYINQLDYNIIHIVDDVKSHLICAIKSDFDIINSERIDITKNM